MKNAALFLSIIFFSVLVSTVSHCEEVVVREWSPYSGIEGLTSVDNVLTMRSVSPIPLLTTRDNIFINASRFKVLEIKLRSNKSYMTGRVFFRRIGDPGFNYNNSFDFQTGLNNIYHRYIIDLGRNPNWFGTVSQIMISPINGEGKVDIADIKFLEPNIWLTSRSFWQDFFVFEKPLPRTINFIYGPRINGISVNVYIYWSMILISLAAVIVYWSRSGEPAAMLKLMPSKIIIICFIFWLLLDARSAVDQIRSAVIDWQTFGGKTLQEKQALSTGGGFYDFYHFLKYCGEKIPSGSKYSLVVPPNAIYFIDKSRYYLYPTYENTTEAQYVLVYDPQKDIKTSDLPGGGFKRYTDYGNNRYILKRSGL